MTMNCHKMTGNPIMAGDDTPFFPPSRVLPGHPLPRRGQTMAKNLYEITKNFVFLPSLLFQKRLGLPEITNDIVKRTSYMVGGLNDQNL